MAVATAVAGRWSWLVYKLECHVGVYADELHHVVTWQESGGMRVSPVVLPKVLPLLVLPLVHAGVSACLCVCCYMCMCSM